MANKKSNYEVIFIDDHGEEALICGEVEMDDNPAFWSFWMVSNVGVVPSLHSMITTSNPRGRVTLNARLPGWDFDGKPYIKMALMYGSSKSDIDDDWCPKCRVRADFIRCALKCPQCGDVLGGC